ncbi:uncharacterized protein LOC108740689 [Agrilus planipennis]|uniref:Uncharacterized protein LOC108740689 n=1 Tax=Agrilus planipennis TaxID=224129 RepID=A0A1W4X3B2_AGRPL|nr:uncharacterized protein LOC108740689 [Agrilus planipennis]
MSNKWNSDDDFSRDIQELSVFGTNGYFDKEILSNADEIRTRLQITRRSRFDDDERFNQILNDDSTICENVVFCKPVRGRPLKNIPLVDKPGGKSSFLDKQNETSATIRRVCMLWCLAWISLMILLRTHFDKRTNEKKMMHQNEKHLQCQIFVSIAQVPSQTAPHLLIHHQVLQHFLLNSH